MPIGSVDIVPPLLFGRVGRTPWRFDAVRWAGRAAEREGTSLRTEGPFAKLASGFAIASTLGLGFATTTGLGIWLGYRCDRALGWTFYGCTLALGVLGGGAGLVFIVRTLASLDRRDRARDGGESQRSRDDGGVGRDHEDS